MGAATWNIQPNAALGVAADGDGNVYIAGTTSGSLGGPNRGSDDAWVAKYSTSL